MTAPMAAKAAATLRASAAPTSARLSRGTGTERRSRQMRLNGRMPKRIAAAIAKIATRDTGSSWARAHVQWLKRNLSAGAASRRSAHTKNAICRPVAGGMIFSGMTSASRQFRRTGLKRFQKITARGKKTNASSNSGIQLVSSPAVALSFW